ncbi:MAG: ATP-binding protein [Candidatus Zhuqueibacterota bacterium]
MNDSENNLSENLVNSNGSGIAEQNLQYNFMIQSSTDQITSTIQLFERLLDDARCCSSQMRSELATALSEALANAIIHGNKRQATKTVSIKILITSEHIQLTINDQGDGFDFKELPNPLNPNNLKKTNGRGVYLMSLLMDKVKFTRKKDGMEVVLIKLLKNRN